MNTFMAERQYKKARQQAWLEAFKSKAFNITAACKQIGIDRSLFYKWMGNPLFAQRVKDVMEEKLDFIESKLFQKVKDGDITAIIFALMTLGKHRGYIERQEVTGPNGASLTPMDIKILLQNPDIRIALETISKEFYNENEQNRKAVSG